MFITLIHIHTLLRNSIRFYIFLHHTNNCNITNTKLSDFIAQQNFYPIFHLLPYLLPLYHLQMHFIGFFFSFPYQTLSREKTLGKHCTHIQSHSQQKKFLFCFFLLLSHVFFCYLQIFYAYFPLIQYNEIGNLSLHSRMQCLLFFHNKNSFRIHIYRT